MRAILVVLSLVLGVAVSEGWSYSSHAGTSAPKVHTGLVRICETSHYTVDNTCSQSDDSISSTDLQAGGDGPALAISVGSVSDNSSAVAELFRVDKDSGQTVYVGFSNLDLNQVSPYTGKVLSSIIGDAYSSILGDAGSTFPKLLSSVLKDGATYIVRVDFGSKAVYGGNIGSARFTYHAQNEAGS